MLYTYEAWSEDGKPVAGTIEADSLKEAQQSLKVKNISVNSIRAQRNFLSGLQTLVTRVILLVLSGGVAFSLMAAQGMGQTLSMFIGAGVGLLSICFVMLAKQ